jgi:hypothetical protein
MATLITQAEFASLENKARSYITALKNAGRLVMEGDKVNVEASRARIKETADPNRDDVKTRWEADRQKPNPAVDDQNAANSADKIGNSYQAARAVKEKFAAMTAKLEYERAIGKLVEKSEVAAAVEDVASVFRQTMENLPYRAASELINKDLDAIRATLKQEIHSALSEMDREFAKRLESLTPDEQ